MKHIILFGLILLSGCIEPFNDKQTSGDIFTVNNNTATALYGISHNEIITINCTALLNHTIKFPEYNQNIGTVEAKELCKILTRMR